MYHSLAQSPRTLGALPPQNHPVHGVGWEFLGLNSETWHYIAIIGGVGIVLGALAMHHFERKPRRKKKYTASPFANLTGAQNPVWQTLLLAGATGGAVYLLTRGPRNAV